MRKVGSVIVMTVLGFLAYTPGASAQSWPEPGCHKAPDAFARQYGQAVLAYKNRDKDALKTALESFKLTSEWFTSHFGKELGTKLQNEYANQFAYFELDQLRKLHTISIFGSPEFQICPDHHPQPPVKPAPVSLIPIPDAQMVMTRAGASWADLYAEVDGDYRFFGTGGYPFWDPARIQLTDMCHPGADNGGQIIKRVEPRYPTEVQATSKPGRVAVRLTVSPEGSVTDVEFVEGDPAFFTAAKEAAMQWQFIPWRNCGKPVMMRTIQNVIFTPPTDHPANP